MILRLIQVNLNHACQAQSLFWHTLAERGGGIGIVSELYRVPKENPNWSADDTKSAAIVWRTTQDIPPCTPVEQKRGIVVVDWCQYTIISVYATPRMSLQEYED